LTTITVTSTLPADRSDAAALVFEYMAATQAENGRPVPDGIAELPAVLRRECTGLQDVYRPPGVFLIADLGGRPVGCAGLSALPGGRTAEVRRLYVRPAHCGNGIARTLMSQAHDHAARHGMTGLEHHSRLVVIQTPVIERIVNRGGDLIRMNRVAHYGRSGLMVSGPIRTGKTTAVTQLGKTAEVMHRHRNPHSRDDIPVIYITVPPAATGKMIAMEWQHYGRWRDHTGGYSSPENRSHADCRVIWRATPMRAQVTLRSRKMVTSR
jgi:GNAT superfamily N-acetyltransferase